MGSYISVGIVYSDNDVHKMNDDLNFIIKYLSHFCNKIIIKYSENSFFKNWKEKIFDGKKGLYEAFKILNKNNMSSGKICCRIDNNDYNIIVSIKNNNALLKGILFEIPEEELLKNDYSNKSLNNITNKIIERLLELWNYSRFSYAFCDNEADIEYQLFEVNQNKKQIYSLLLLKNNLNEPKVQLSSWHINGISQRE